MLKSASMLFAAAAALSAAALPPGISVDENGALKLGGLSAAVNVYDKSWNLSIQNKSNVVPEPSYPVPSEKVYELKGTLRVPNTDGFTIQEWVRELSADTATYSMSLKNEEGIRCQTVALAISLPSHRFEGRELTVNGKTVPVKNMAQPIYHVKTLEIVNGDKRITVKGDFPMVIQDHRNYSVQSFSIRLLFSQSSGLVRDSKLDFSVTVTPLAVTPLSLDKASAGRMTGEPMAKLLKNHGTNGGEITVGSVKFALGDVKRKSGSLLKLGAGERSIIPVSGSGRELYLLQNATESAAKPAVTAVYADGGRKRLDLAEGREFSTAKPLGRLPNGALSTSDNVSFDGLYFTHFTLSAGELEALEFENSGAGNWVVAAATLAEGVTPPASVESIHYISEGKEWAPMEAVKPVVKGSILDFSGMLDAPAGKYGWITTDRAGHFTAEKAQGKRFRFFGPNFCFSAQYLDKADAEKLADEMARLGFTSVRFHHYDNALSDPKGNDSTELLPEKLDRLDYLFYCLKERGIYITLDLYCSRRFRSGELADAPVRDGYAMKQLLSVYPPARENWKKFVRNLLTHRNPYTGLTWGGDPALFAVSLSNENLTFGNWSGKAKQLYLDGYKAYLEKRGIATKENLENRGGLFYRYLADLNIEMIRDLSGFVHNELGYKGLITEINFKQNAAISEVRDTLAFVDNHNYWDHPNSLPGRSWSFPFLHNQMSALKAAGWNPRTLMPSRIFGKPFTVTEINFVFPNRHRAESGPLLGAYASLQDWDGLYRFAWSHDDKGVRHESPINRFDIAEDSLSQIAERVTNLMFVRGDVKPAGSGIAWPFGESTFREMNSIAETNFPVDFSMLGFYCKIGSLRENGSFPGVKLIKTPKEFMKELSAVEQKAVREPVKVSETGEIAYDIPKGSLRVVAPLTESLSFFSGALSGDVLKVSGGTPVFQVVTASSMDGRPLARSGKILLFHQSDVTNRHIRYSSESMNAVEHWGKKAPLIRRASADVQLKLAPGDYKVRAIGLDGLPKGELPAKFEAGVLHFTVDTAKFGGTMVYAIEK
ncbi:MAG: hypothetical protein HPZ91_16435 [Lentisphaeria bacterium]|nr:hypothetical protein [Lentisphaeria bacterium]